MVYVVALVWESGERARGALEDRLRPFSSGRCPIQNLFQGVIQVNRFRPAMFLVFTSILIALVFFGAQLKVPTAFAFPGGAGSFNPAAPTTNVCTPCHSGTTPTGGGVVINFPSGMTSYTPGGPAIPMSVTVTDPTLTEWGFQLNARLATNLATQEGTFTAGATSNLNSGAVEGSGTSSSTFTFNWTPPATAAGTVNFYASGIALPHSTNNNGIYTSTSMLTPAAAATPDYSLSALPTSLTLIQGSSGPSTITVAPVNGFTGSVGLSASGVPSGVTATFSPTNTTGTSTLTLAASSTATTGTSTVTITGASGILSHTTTVSLTVNAPAMPDFRLSAMPSSLAVTQGASGSSTITVAALNGFTGSVGLSASGVPSGVTATFSPISTTGTSTLTLAASSTATTGNSLVTVMGASGSLIHTTTITLTVNSAAGTSTLTISPSSLTFSYQSGGSTSGSQSLRITHSGGRVSYSISTSGGPWLTASPTTGRTPGTITVSVSASGMSSGNYSGTIQVSTDDAGSKTVPVTLNVTSSSCGLACGGTATMYAAPYVYDPSSSGTLTAQWVSRLGVPTGNPPAPVDPGLVLSKNATAPAGSIAGAYIRNVTGSLTELGFDYREGGQCTTSSPRLVVVTSLSGTHVVGGCSKGTISAPMIGTTPVAGWKRVRFNLADPLQVSPALLPGDTITSITLVLDQGPGTDPAAAGGLVVIDNIDINGTLVGRGPYSSTGE